MSDAPVKPQHEHHHQQQQQRQRLHQHHHQQPLHNFSLPSFLKWPSSNSSVRVRREPHPPRAPASPKRSNGGGHVVGDANPKKEDLDAEGSVQGDDGRKPWKLRPRRGVMATAAAASMGVRNGEQDGGVGNRSRRNGDGGEQKKEEKEEGKKKRRLWIALTKEEIEEDVFIMTGCRPSRRPKKRNKTEQKQLDVIVDCFYKTVVGGHDGRCVSCGRCTAEEMRRSETLPEGFGNYDPLTNSCNKGRTRFGTGFMKVSVE